MSRTKRFLYNSISTALYQLTVMLVGFITPRVILEFYGSELNGLVSSITQFITDLSLVEAGLAGAAVFAMYGPLAKEDKDELSAVVSATKKLYFQAGWMFTGLIAIMALVYPLFIRPANLSPIEVGILVVVLGAKSFLDFFTLAKYKAILTADQKTYVVSNASTVYVILQMVIIVIMSLLRVNITIVYTVVILALFARSFILMIYVRHHYPYINYKAKPNTKALSKRWDALFLQALGVAQTGAPIQIATIFTQLTDVSIYTIYNMVFVGINGVLNIFVNGLSAGFGDVIVRNEKQTLQKSYSQFEYAYYILITIVYSVTGILLLPFIEIYTAGVRDGVNYILPAIAFLFVANGFLFNLKTPQGMLVISAGLYKETRYRSLAQALIIVIGGVILAPLFGLVGILIASCLSNLYRCIDLMFFIPKNVTGLPVKNSALRMLLSIALVTALIFVSSFIPFEIHTIISWLVHAVIITAVVSVIVVLINILTERKQFMAVVQRIKNMVKR